MRIRCDWVSPYFAVVVGLLHFCQTTALASGVSYEVVNEKIYDQPIKTQIEQHIVVTGVPTKTELETEILNRYRIAATRRGFRYHNPATNIYVYVYGTEIQARAGQGLWVGMIAKSRSDKRKPKVIVNEDRLAALSRMPEERFGLSEQKRIRAFREISEAEKKAMHEAMARVPDSQIMKQIDLERNLLERYKSEIRRKYGITKDQASELAIEGVKKGWPH